MNPAPFVNASTAIQVHAVAALLALVLGAAILWRRKGGAVHKALGRAWVGLMLVASFSAFFIHELRVWGDYSPIHGLAIVTPLGLVAAIRAARRREIARHRAMMQTIYLGALVVAGIFTLMPGRILYRVAIEPLAGDVPASAVGPFVAVCGLTAIGLAGWWRVASARSRRKLPVARG